MPVSETMMGPLVHGARQPRRKRERDFDKNVGGGVDRDKLPDSDFAGPDHSFPIKTPKDVEDAASSLGRTKHDKDALKANIIRIAKRKGASFVAKLPNTWKATSAREGFREAFRTGDRLQALELREADGEDKEPSAKILIIRAGPGNPDDRHFYSTECLEKSVEDGKWDGAHCFIDHPTTIEDKVIPERKVDKMAGYFVDPRMVDVTDERTGNVVRAIEADFRPEIGNETVLRKLRTAVQYSKQFPKRSYVGFSINAEGVGHPVEIGGREWNQVDEILNVTSVDIVTRAGAGGKLLSLREAYRMAESATQEAEGKVSFSEAHRKAVKEALTEGGVQLTKDQDDALDKALGLEDGGDIDKVIDKATGAEDFKQGDDEEKDDMAEANREADKDNEKEAARKKREAAAASTREADQKDDEDEDDAAKEAAKEADEADETDDEEREADELGESSAMLEVSVKEMTRKQLEAFAARKATEAREAKKSAASLKREAVKARESARAAKTKLGTILRERSVETVLRETGVPEGLRPRMKRMLLRESGGVDEMREIVKDELSAFGAVQSDGGGAVLRESAAGSKLKIDCFRVTY